eukprot:gene18624-biopygen23432
MWCALHRDGGESSRWLCSLMWCALHPVGGESTRSLSAPGLYEAGCEAVPSAHMLRPASNFGDFGARSTVMVGNPRADYVP